MMKKISIFMVAILFSLLFSSTSTFAKVNDISPYYYVYNDKDLLTRTEVDEVSMIGEILSLKGYDLIFNVSDDNVGTDNSESKDIFYKYLKKIDNSSIDRKVIVLSYYTNSNELQVYDDYGLFNDSFIEEMQIKLNKYNKNDLIGEGVIYVYKSLSKYINEKQKLGISSISDMEVEYLYDGGYYFNFRNIFLITTIGILIFGFRRNKNH